MDDLFATPEVTDAAELPPVHRNGKTYTLRPVGPEKEPKWGINWTSDDGKRSGAVGGWYHSPDLAYAAIDMVASA